MNCATMITGTRERAEERSRKHPREDQRTASAAAASHAKRFVAQASLVIRGSPRSPIPGQPGAAGSTVITVCRPIDGCARRIEASIRTRPRTAPRSADPTGSVVRAAVSENSAAAVCVRSQPLRSILPAKLQAIAWLRNWPAQDPASCRFERTENALANRVDGNRYSFTPRGQICSWRPGQRCPQSGHRGERPAVRNDEATACVVQQISNGRAKTPPMRPWQHSRADTRRHEGMVHGLRVAQDP